jgi:hypothetical protein
MMEKPDKKDPTLPKPFMHVEEFGLSLQLLSLFFEFDWHET